jgi:hypothetical protein
MGFLLDRISASVGSGLLGGVGGTGAGAGGAGGGGGLLEVSYIRLVIF